MPKLTLVLFPSVSTENRSSISLAAALVNVMTRICPGSTPRRIRFRVLCVITVVLPEPGPARTIMGPPV